MKRQAIVLGLGLLSVPSCNGTETGNPPVALDGFDITACKGNSHSRLTLLSASVQAKSVQKGDASGVSAATGSLRYTGRNCAVWQRSGEDMLELGIANYAAGCVLPENWEPQVEVSEDGTLDLRMENPSCLLGRCGWCLYDLRFSVRLHEAPAIKALRLWGHSCGRDARVDFEAELPLASEAQGEACDYANKWALQERCPRVDDDYLYRPCGALGAACDAEVCPDGLSCHEVATDDLRCVPSCSSDADCAPYAGTRCKEQLCLL